MTTNTHQYESRRVLLLGEYGACNGGENSLLSVLPALQSFGWEFAAAVPQPSEFASALADLDVEVHDLNLFDTAASSDQSAVVRKTQSEKRAVIRQLITETAPALVHCNSLSTSRLCGPVTAAMGIPSLGYLRDILKLSGQAIADLNKVNRRIAVSDATRTFHVANGLEESQTQVVYNGIDTDVFHPWPEGTYNAAPHNSDGRSQTQTELDLPSESKLLLFVGQIGIRKGIADLIEAFLLLCQRDAQEASRPHLELLIVGERNSQKDEAVEYEKACQQRIQQSEFADRVHWLGRREDVARLMRDADLLLHPAKQEPLGRVLLEAAASGLPPITTLVGGSAEILHGFDSLLIDPADQRGVAAAMADRVAAFFSPKTDDMPASELSAQLRSQTLRRFSIAQCAVQLDGQYRQLLE